MPRGLTDREQRGYSVTEGTPPERPAITLSSPDKVLYPEQGIEKRELAEHYVRVADAMLPHVVDRPLMLLRCPEGRKKSCFFQKHPQVSAPRALRRVAITERSGPATYAVIDDLEGLVSLVQIGTLEIHTWGSRAADLEHPDLLVIDLDPDPAVGWPEVVECARLVRQVLEELELECFAKLTGGKGLHVCVPLQASAGWDEVKTFARALARSLVRLDPELYVDTASKQKRTGKIFVDYLRNTRGATFIAPYSTRARAGAPVAAPVAFSELDELGPDSITLTSLPDRLAARVDPWESFFEVRQTLSSASIASVLEASRAARKKRSH